MKLMEFDKEAFLDCTTFLFLLFAVMGADAIPQVIEQLFTLETFIMIACVIALLLLAMVISMWAIMTFGAEQEEEYEEYEEYDFHGW